MTLWRWSQTANNNDDIDPSINWQEGQAPRTVNNSARGMMAAIAKWRDDMSGNLVTGGTATAFTIASNQSLTALTDGFSITARMSATSGASPTLNVDSLGAKSIASVYGTALPTGSLTSGSIQRFTYDSTDDKWIVNGFNPVTLTGDVTGSGPGSFTTTIANDAVTYAKMQDVSATSKVLGRKTASSGNVEECSLSEVLDMIGSAAQGDILYRGASAWARLGTGTDGQHLKAGGAGANPSWADAPVTSIRLGTKTTESLNLGASTKGDVDGSVLVGILTSGNTENTYLRAIYRPLQAYINGAWATVSVV